MKNRPDKVLYFSTDNSKASGAFLSLCKLIDIMKSIYNIDAIVVLPYRGDGEDLLKSYGIKYVYIRSYHWIVSTNLNIVECLKRMLGFVLNIVPVLRCTILCKHFKPDLIHINTSYGYVGYLVGKICKIPIIWHIREFLEEDQQSRFLNKKLALKWIDKSNDVIAISNSVNEKYSKLLSRVKIKTIYNGVDEKLFYYNKAEYFTGKKLRIVSVGGLYPGKGHTTILKGLKLVVDRGYTNLELAIVGKGPCKDELYNLVKELSIDNYVTFLGFRDDVANIYHEYDVAIMSSVAEAFGRVTVEAMMSGLLVLGADTAATKEVLGDGEFGLLFKMGDEQDLADLLVFVLTHPKQCIEMASKGQKYALSTFSSRNNAEKIYEEYLAVLKG